MRLHDNVCVWMYVGKQVVKVEEGKSTQVLGLQKELRRRGRDRSGVYTNGLMFQGDCDGEFIMNLNGRKEVWVPITKELQKEVGVVLIRLWEDFWEDVYCTNNIVLTPI